MVTGRSDLPGVRLPVRFLLPLALAACRPTPAADPVALDAIARRYVVLGLGLAYQGNAQFTEHGYPSAGLPWWVAALTALALAAWLADRTAPPPAAPHRWRRADWVALFGVLAIAALTRLWRLGEYPPADLFAYEEFQTGAEAYGVYLGWKFPWEFPLTNIFPGLTFSLFGRNSWGLRAPFVASGIIAPMFLFLALRRLVSLPAAFTGAALLAAARWPAVAARFADEIFFPIWIVALAFWLLVRAVQSWRQIGLLLFALIASDLFYAYTAYRAIPITAAGIHRQWHAATLVAAGRLPHVEAFIDLLGRRSLPALKRPLSARHRATRAQGRGIRKRD